MEGKEGAGRLNQGSVVRLPMDVRPESGVEKSLHKEHAMNRFLVLIAATLVSFGAFAQDPAQATPLSFEALDKDADQKLTASEAISDAGLAKNFAAADTDQDGYISRDEFNTYHEQG